MKEVAPLRYDVIFKKAFGEKEIFTAFIHDLLGIKLEISAAMHCLQHAPCLEVAKLSFTSKTH